MTIYVTQFDADTRECTSVSSDSGFVSLDDVTAAMGEPLHQYKTQLIYASGSGSERISVAFNVDPVVNNG